jgi:hypothetical protein
MKSSSDPSIPSSTENAKPDVKDLAIRAAFLEAFARELVRDMPCGGEGAGESTLDDVAATFDLPEDGFRPVNRLAGLF